jgi:hypothetical protein
MKPSSTYLQLTYGSLVPIDQALSRYGGLEAMELCYIRNKWQGWHVFEQENLHNL